MPGIDLRPIVWLAVLGLIALAVIVILIPFACYWAWTHIQVVVR